MSGQQPGYWIENGVLWYASDSSGDFNSKHEIENADLSTLKVFNQTWAKDDKRVWAAGFKVRKVYAPAFQALNASFGRDNECVFDSVGRTVKGINAAAFEVLDEGLVHFDHHQDTKIAGYARCEGKIYHFEHFDHKTMCLRGADAGTFEVLRWGLGRDKKKVFKGQYVIKANPQTFHQITSLYSTDGQQVFYDTRIVPEADPATFEFIGGQFWARDKSRVYFQAEIVPGPDPATSRVVGDLLADASAVFLDFYGKVITGLDAATVEHLGYCFYRHKSRVYSRFDKAFIEGADRDTFENLPPKHPSGGDAWDKNWIYYNTRPRKRRSEFQE
jgi:hypothetical protein